MRRLAPVTLLLCLLAPGVAQPAAAATGCIAHVTKLRYRPQITWTCAGVVAPTPTAVVTRVATHAVVGTDPIAGAGTNGLALNLHGDLASGATYAVTLSYDDGGGPVALKTTWKTLPPPAHPALHVKYITAIPPAAVLDIAHRMDAANVFAVPRPADFVDAATTTLSAAQYSTALRAHQSALVVTDRTVKSPGSLGTALAQYCSHGHGVVLGGQTHWLNGANEGWQTASAIGGQTSVFASKWAMYTYDDVFPDHVSTGPHQLAPGSVQPHFLTRGLTRFTVIGPGSGEPIIQDYSSGHVLATLQHESPGSPFHTFPQVFLAERQIGAGRVVDLGFRPWSSAVTDPGFSAAVSRGGFDPAKSAGGGLTARSLWWATNRIPPTDTHFSLKPANPSNRATVVFDLAAKDADPDGFRDLRFRYRVDHGSWRWAVGNSFVLYHLAQGSVHTVYGRAVDSGGNVDAHAAHYTFRVAPGALG
jgi:hypothetical protein